jgi:hypothetical protein
MFAASTLESLLHFLPRCLGTRDAFEFVNGDYVTTRTMRFVVEGCSQPFKMCG